ncbi:MAG: DNA polymerase/3'-5' exonuclease PolX [Bdellovibrionota bacterium]
MPAHNSDIAGIFDQVADLLEIQAANPFRVRAYRNASRVVGNWPLDLADQIRHGRKLPKIPGLGKDLAAKVAEIAQTGHLSSLDQLKQNTPEGLLALLRLPGLGPKRVQSLQTKLGIESLQDLKAALIKKRLNEIPGFGEKLVGKIEAAISKNKEARPRMPLAVAEQTALPVLAYLRASKGVLQAEVAGSFRRRCETVGDLDILVAATPESNVMKRFLQFEDVSTVLAQGETKSTVLLKSGLQIDLRVVPERSYGAALHYFTGSKAHNIAIRKLGIQHKLKINEYGVYRGSRWISGTTESDVFRSVDLPFIEPELRENRGEIEAARAGTLPRLLTLQTIRGDLHAHTNSTDGRLNLSGMAAAAEAMGYEYLAITDHSRHLTVARGLTPARLKTQIRQIDQFNEKSKKLRLLKGIEVDILEDGSLDLPDDVLAMLDFTVCSIHSQFELSEAKQTERVLRAMDNPYFQILGHPTARLLGTRLPIQLNLERIIQGAKDRGCFLELKAQPERMDLSDIYCRLAKDQGVKIALSTDAHSDNDLRNMKFGISQARRAWLEAEDVLNTLPWKELKKQLRRK